MTAADELQIARLYNAGHVLEALARIPVRREGELEVPEAVENAWVCVSIAAGRYRQVRQWAEHVRPELLGGVGALSADDLLLRINVCEALVNLGEFERVLTLVPDVAGGSYASGALRAMGVAASLRAWVLWILKRHDVALRELEFARGSLELLGDYQSEYFMMLALNSAGLGRHEAVDDWLLQAQLHVRRASSARNLYVTRGRCARAAGQLARASEYFEYAAQSHFRFQNADGLMEWSDVLTSLGEPDRARQARAWALERDPESWWVRQLA